MKDFLENLQVEVPDEDKLLREIDDIEKKEINLTNDDEEKRTALHLACDLGFTKLVKKIIAKGADVNLIDGYKLSPLMTVCSLEDVNIELIKALLEKEPDLYHVTGKKNSALHIAIINKHTEVVKIIIDHLKENKNTLRDILQQKNKDGFTPIDLALINNDNISDYLIKSVNSPNLKDSWIRIYGLSTDDSVKQRGAKKKSELMAQKQKVDEEKQRIENLKNKTVKEDKTIPEDLLRLLGVFRQNRGSFAEDQWTRITDTNTGLTLLHAASYIGDNDSADELLAMKAGVNIQDKGNKTPLDYAKTELMKDLLKKVGGKTGQELERERLDQEREMLEAQEKDRQQSLSKKESDSQDAQTLTNDQRIRPISDAHHDGDEDEELSVAVRVGQLDQRSSLAIIPYENIDADFQARLREYHLHTTHSDNQNVCYNPQLKKELLGSGSSGVSDFHKTLGAQAEENRNKNYSKVTLLASPEKNSFSDYGLASQDALDNCTLKTFPLPDGVKLNMAVDKATGKVYLSETSIKEIRNQGLTLSIKIPSKTGGAPEYLEFINGVLHIVDTPVGESRIAGKAELHGLAGYEGEVQTYSGQLALTNQASAGSSILHEIKGLESSYLDRDNSGGSAEKRRLSDSVDDNIFKKTKTYHLSSRKEADVISASFPELASKINYLQKEIHDEKVRYHNDFKEHKNKLDEERQRVDKTINGLEKEFIDFSAVQYASIPNFGAIKNKSKKRKFAEAILPGSLLPNIQKAKEIEGCIEDERKRIDELKIAELSEISKLENKSEEDLAKSSAKISDKEIELNNMKSGLQTLTEKESKLIREYKNTMNEDIPVSYNEISEKDKIFILNKTSTKESANMLKGATKEVLEKRVKELSQAQTLQSSQPKMSDVLKGAKGHFKKADLGNLRKNPTSNLEH
jgi:ankyrin repeat protein